MSDHGNTTTLSPSRFRSARDELGTKQKEEDGNYKLLLRDGTQRFIGSIADFHERIRRGEIAEVSPECIPTGEGKSRATFGGGEIDVTNLSRTPKEYERVAYGQEGWIEVPK